MDRKDTAEEIKVKIRNLCPKISLELLIFDEAHHLVGKQNDDAQDDISEAVKSFLNWIPAQVVFCGLPKLMNYESFGQTWRRFGPSVLLEPYNWSEEPDQIEFRAMLGHFEMLAGFSKITDLTQYEHAKRMYCATGGHVGLVSKYMSLALSICIEERRDCMDLEVLGAVYASMRREARVRVNPDPDAVPGPARKILRDSRNPFLANNADFRVLWREMVKKQDAMVKSANERIIRDQVAGPDRASVAE